VTVDFLPGALAEVARRYPRVELDVAVTESGTVAARVADGAADIGLGFPMVGRRELRRVAVRGFPFGAVMPPDHRLAAAERLDLADLLGEPLILPAADTHAGGLIRAVVDRRGLPVRAAIRSTSFAFGRSAVLAGLGIAFQTRLGIEPDLAAGTLVHVPLSDGEPMVQELAILVRADRALPVAAATLVDILTDRLLSV
jgi:DNA-binding transcriptional LysR family regulator